MLLKNIFRQALGKLKDPIERRKSIFYFVIDIPYSAVGIGVTSEEVVSKNKGNCQTKSRLLESLFNLAGYKTRKLKYKYLLKDIIKEVKYIPEQSDYHHTLEIRIRDKWVLCDCTYDKPLAKLGFIVNEWDGVSSTSYSEAPTSKIGTPDKNLDIEFDDFNKRVVEACNNYSIEIEKYSNDLEALFINARN